MRKSVLISAISLFILAALSVPASAQVPGDLNCNGFMDVSDLVGFLNAFNLPCDFSFGLECVRRNSDVDLDGIPMTIADIIIVPSLLNSYYNPPYFPQHPDSDTIMVESTTADPGETIALPFWVKTIDTLVAFQFLLEVDPDYIEFDSVIVYDDFPLKQHNCDGNIYCNSMAEIPNSHILLLPGNHHIADIIITVNPDINQQVTTGLYFSSVPPQALYTGFANSTFFLPVRVDAEIEIIPMTSVDQPNKILPREVEISVYPNPFNSNTNISVTSESAGELSIYDILGRPVRSFGISPGPNDLNWDATDEFGQQIRSGIYFVGLNNGRDYNFKKVLYLK